MLFEDAAELELVASVVTDVAFELVVSAEAADAVLFEPLVALLSELELPSLSLFETSLATVSLELDASLVVLDADFSVTVESEFDPALLLTTVVSLELSATLASSALTTD